ncbi:hypothetical protein NHX12_008250 [Muraenolepis orangiensis]|uniref:Uncharacterized protein n=1 Tax=Muraenolepis orangiensis TaxID=630683 RepID=A0A9Q0DPJ2_9TELE|nr:hypothetical protein NHX12_008250 [Muraenolepis orangiensis]
MPSSVSVPRGPGEEQQRTGVLPDPSVPVRNIQMKFSVLVGLVQVGQVGDRDLVDTVLNLDYWALESAWAVPIGSAGSPLAEEHDGRET